MKTHSQVKSTIYASLLSSIFLCDMVFAQSHPQSNEADTILIAVVVFGDANLNASNQGVKLTNGQVINSGNMPEKINQQFAPLSNPFECKIESKNTKIPCKNALRSEPSTQDKTPNTASKKTGQSK